MGIGFNETYTDEFLERFKDSNDTIVFKPNDKNRIAWNILIKRGLIEHLGQYEFKITTKGKIVLRLGGWDEYIDYEEQKENKETKKAHYDLLFSKYRYKTFWIVFVLGLFGGLYSIYDAFIKTQSTEEKLNQINTDTQENIKAIEELRIEISNQKNLDSLNTPNLEKDNVKN